MLYICEGERGQFMNKMKAVNKLKAKLEVIAIEQGVDSINSIMNLWKVETRKYVSHLYKLVNDVNTCIEMLELYSFGWEYQTSCCSSY